MTTRGQDGFSLLSVVVASLIMSISFLFISQILLQTQIVGQQQERFAQFNDVRDEVMAALADECSVSNTVLASENSAGMKCLYEGSCSAGTARPLTLRDFRNEEVYSENSSKNRLLTNQGRPCDPKQSNCSHEFDMTYQLKCADGSACKLPFLLVEGSFKPYSVDGKNATEDASKSVNYNLYRFEKQIVYNRPYRNCRDVMERGLEQTPPIQMASGIYLMDPDGAGGECPFRVYCDLAPTSDGGGWALVANQTASASTLIERPPPLYQGMSGRLKEEMIQALLQNSSSPGHNNVRIRLDTRTSGKNVLTFSVPKSGAAGTYTTKQTYCQSVDAKTEATTLAGQGVFSFLATGPQVQIGYKDQKLFCNSCDVTVINGVCNEMPNGGCCSKTTPVEGTVWVR